MPSPVEAAHLSAFTTVRVSACAERFPGRHLRWSLPHSRQPRTDVDCRGRWTISIARQRRPLARSSRPNHTPDRLTGDPTVATRMGPIRAPLSCTRIMDAARPLRRRQLPRRAEHAPARQRAGRRGDVAVSLLPQQGGAARCGRGPAAERPGPAGRRRGRRLGGPGPGLFAARSGRSPGLTPT